MLKQTNKYVEERALLNRSLLYRLGFILCAALWGAILLNLIVPFSDEWKPILFWMGGFLFIAHLSEVVVFRKSLGATGNLAALDFLFIMIAGLVHGLWLKKNAKPSLSQR